MEELALWDQRLYLDSFQHQDWRQTHTQLPLWLPCIVLCSGPYSPQGKKGTQELWAAAPTTAQCWGRGLQVPFHIRLHIARQSQEQFCSAPCSSLFLLIFRQVLPPMELQVRKRWLPPVLWHTLPKGATKGVFPSLIIVPYLGKHFIDISEMNTIVIPAISPLWFIPSSPHRHPDKF